MLNPGVQGSRQSSIAFDSGQSGFDLGGFVTRYGRLFGGDVAVAAVRTTWRWRRNGVLKGKKASATSLRMARRVAIGGTIDTSGMSIAGMTADAARNTAVDGGTTSRSGDAPGDARRHGEARHAYQRLCRYRQPGCLGRR